MKPAKPPDKGRRWTSFVADLTGRGRLPRALCEETNPAHRLRVTHDKHTLLVQLSGEDGKGWTTFAVDRKTRQWAVAQAESQGEAARAAYDSLYE
ncbi:MAG: hypothetical protein ACYCW6_25110 [Candidatus Xenobia bacterium]